MSRVKRFGLPLGAIMSQLYGYIFSMLISNVLVDMPLFGGALYLCGRAVTVLTNVYGRKNRRYLPGYARIWGLLLTAALLVVGVLLMGLYPAGFHSPRVWIVFAAVALCLCADGMAVRISRLRRTARKTPRRAWITTILLQVIIAAAMGIILFTNMEHRSAANMTAAFFLLSAIRAYSAFQLYSGEPEEPEPGSEAKIDSERPRAYRCYEAICLLIITAVELTVSAIYALLATGTERVLPALAVGVGCTLAACAGSILFLHRTRKPSRQDPTWLLCAGLVLWLGGVILCSIMLRNGTIALNLVYLCLAASSAGSTLCFAGLIRIDELMSGMVLLTGQNSYFFRKQRETNRDLALLLGDVLSLIMLSILCFVHGDELPKNLPELAARFQPVMIVPLILVMIGALVSAFRFPLSARYIEKLRLFLRLRESGEDNPALRRQLEHVLTEPYRQPWLTRFIMAVLRPFYRHSIIDADHIETDETNPLVFLGNHAEIYGPIACALFFPVPVRFWTISMMMGRRQDVRDYLYENTFSKKTFLPVFVRKGLARFLGWLSVNVMSQLEAIPVYRDSPIKLRETIRASIDALESGDNLMIFPENPEGKYQKSGIGEISPGFLMLAEAYWKKKKKKLRMLPVYANRENRTLSFGSTITYEPENGFAREQVRIVAETTEQILKMADAGRDDVP